jgi:hypothetical protein
MPGVPLAAPDAAPAAPSHAELLACQLCAWYPSLAPHALRSIVISLPDEFVSYLDSDGVFVGESSAAVGHALPRARSPRPPSQRHGLSARPAAAAAASARQGRPLRRR